MARLLVLWLLNERSMYGYEIKKSLSDSSMAFWFGLDDASVYSVLRTLTKHGHAREVRVEQEGNRPVRTRFAITASGRRHYRRLLTDALTAAPLPVAPIDVALAARGDLDATAVSAALAERLKRLSELEAAITDHRPSSPSDALVDRNLAVVRAERTWLAQLDQSTIT